MYQKKKVEESTKALIGLFVSVLILLGTCALLWSLSGCKVIAEPTQFTVIISWIAPGDNGNTGTASQYDLRYSHTLITDANWNDATRIIESVPVPEIAGTPQQMIFVFQAESEVTIHFAIKARDESNNWSEISTFPYVTPDNISPAKIAGFKVSKQ